MFPDLKGEGGGAGGGTRSVCVRAFIFGALLEFALVNWAARQDLVRQGFRARQQANLFFRPSDPSHGYYTALPETFEHEIEPRSCWSRMWYMRYTEHSRRIDLISRVMFPLFFIIFNITYWYRYLIPYLAVQPEDW
ncbi:unnamed protein product [Caenorhabditis auriculariae]|uniref:Neurotransmitter-gated ion-channel transmembrane domain-containing protein n=1 Tax=Caenorhabditis auriculariae TaxID=2777116 RepID=A0A8S1HQ32_9PELO|nr:unnamed protein product [Caenorhabditis auriculariae]